jgi:molecular chaperone DnaJ
MIMKFTKGKDLIYTQNKRITVSEAILGFDFDIDTIRGPIMISMPPGIQNGDVKKVINHGINKLPPLQKQRGHHFVTFEVEIPIQLTDQQRELFSEYAKLEVKPSASF